MKKHVISKSFETPVKGLSICASICACIVVLLFIAAGVQPGWTEANMKHVNKVAVQPVKDAKKMTGKRMISPGFGNIPLYFIPNKGQMHENALFCAKTPRYNLWLTKEGLVFDSMKKAEIKAAHPAPSGHPSQEGNHAFSHSPHSPKTRRDVSRLIFLKANKNPLVVPGEPTAHRVNYLKGSDKSKWHNGIPTSRAVCYKNLYKKIDLKVYGAVKQIEYDWVIKPGGNPADIRFQYQGVNNVSIDENGNLAIETTFGQWSHKKPLAYQVLSMEPGAGSKEAVDVTFKKLGNNCYGFNVGDYDRDRELIIDPMVIAFSTYLGGSSADYLNGMVIDGTGAIYVTGDTVSSDFPTQDAYQGTLAGAGDVFVSKLSYDGKSLVFSTYLGGSGSESAIDIVLDSSGNIYIGGSTSSTDFPTVNAFQAANAGEDDGFAAKLSADGSSLLYSTYLGGSQYDYIYAIAISGSGEICHRCHLQQRFPSGKCFAAHICQ